jgi:branched-chain amino acid transport system substrate-binding protein
MKPRSSSTRALFALLALVPPALLVAPGCDLVVDADAESCASDADCVNRPNTACDTEQGVCVSLDLCSSNADCPDDQICKHFSPRSCVSLTTAAASDPKDKTSTEPSCTEIYPSDPAVWRDDATLIVGVTSPLSEENAAGEIVPSSTGISITAGAKLAVDEINDKGGIDNTNKIALVLCDDYGNRNFAENNGLALADMGVSVVLGPAYSGQTIEMTTAEGAQAVGTVARGVLAISPSATSPDVTGIKDKAPECVSACGGDTACEAECPGLVWRTSPSDKIQGEAMVKYFKELEPIIKARTGTPITTMKVSVLFKDDSYGKNLSKAVIDGLEFNGKKANQQGAVFHSRNYGADTTPLDTAAIAATIAEKPDAVIIIGTSEIEDALRQIETDWDALSPETKPYYLFGDGGLLQEVMQAANDLGAGARVRGTIPGTQSGNFDNFAAAYVNAFPGVGAPTTFGAAGAYDTIYLLAYGGIAANGAPFTGEQLARGLAKTADVEATVIVAGPTAYGDASNELQNGKGINYEGASGPLDFDVQTGEAPSDIQVWCVDAAETGPFSGRYYDAKTGTMKGTPDPGAGTFGCPF